MEDSTPFGWWKITFTQAFIVKKHAECEASYR